MKLQDRTIIVTGASSGIGRETAKALAARGARVVAVARREERLAQLARDADGTIVPVPADITVDDDRARIVGEAGPVHGLVNVAGVGPMGPVDKVAADEVRRAFELNVLALIDLTQRVLPQMLDRREGHVCNIGSITGFFGTPPLTIYSATKFAVQGFTEGLRREMNGRGVHVSLVAPGPIGTEFPEKAPTGGGLAEGLRGIFESGAVFPAWMVANAVVRAVEHDGMPGYGEISVPRAVGIARLARVPGLNRVVDVATLGLRMLSDRSVDGELRSDEPRPDEQGSEGR